MIQTAVLQNADVVASGDPVEELPTDTAGRGPVARSLRQLGADGRRLGALTSIRLLANNHKTVTVARDKIAHPIPPRARALPTG